MKRAAWVAVWTLAASPLVGCEGGGRQISSESHWVVCGENVECANLEPGATCVEGYCEGADGVRLVSSQQSSMVAQGGATGGASTVGEGGTTGGGASSGAPATGGTNAGAAGASGASTMAGGAGSKGGTSSSGGEGGQSSVAGGGTGGLAEPMCEAIVGPSQTVEIYEGDYLITDAASLSTAQSYAGIGGSLTVGARALDDLGVIRLPALERLGGDLVLTSTPITAIEAPRLEQVGGNVVLRLNSDLVDVDLRQLEAIQGELTVTGNSSLQRLRLDTLSSVGSFDVEGAALASCELSALRSRLSVEGEAGGRADCQCEERCGWLETDCP